MGPASAAFRALAGLPAAELERRMRAGERPDPEQLDGHEYRGANGAGWTRRLGFQDFVKGFKRQPNGRLLGYNRRVRQDGTWAAPSERFAFFEVRAVDPAARDNRYPGALLLDYGAGGNRLLDPSRPIRDYLVRAEPGSDDLLLGRAFLALGPLRPSVTYFFLERLLREAP